MAETPIACPKCGRADAVRKVTSIVSDGTVLTDMSGLGFVPSERGGELVGILGSSTSRSVLVERLSPPRDPAKPSGYSWVGLFLFTRLGLALFTVAIMLATVACSFPLLIPIYREDPFLIFIPITIFAIVVVLLLRWIVTSLRRDGGTTREKRSDFPLRYQKWEHANERWQQLYYCYRDDGVFLPARTILVPVAQMKRLLYALPKQKRQ